MSSGRDFEKAASRGEPSYVWRAGQQRRLDLIREAAGERLHEHVLENGCGVGEYLRRLAPDAKLAVGLEYEFERAREAKERTAQWESAQVVCAAGEALPFAAGVFSAALSHEVLEHVQDDRQSVEEMSRVLRSGGRVLVFTPNRGYPFETHGVYWRGKYRFGNIPLVNYLPRSLRDRLTPHVRVYSLSDMARLFVGLPIRLVSRRVIFGAYDNIIVRFPAPGKLLRTVLHALERTPLQALGLSHFWVLEKTEGNQ